MTEHYNPRTEYINEYGETVNSSPEYAQTDSQEYIEPINNGEFFEQNTNEVGNSEVLAIEMQELLNNLPSEEREGLEVVVEKQAEILTLIESDNLIAREDAECCVLGSAFAAAPTNASEVLNRPLWKKILEGTNKGARVAALALTLSLPMAAEGQTGSGNKEDPVVTHMTDELFGKSVYERITGKRDALKARYAQLHQEKRELYNQLEASEEIVPNSEEERLMFELLEAKRDRKLAEIEEQHVKFTKELMNSDLKDPAVVAYIQKKEAWFKEIRLTVIHDFEVEIRKAHKQRGGDSGAKEIRRKISKIDSELDRIISRQVRKGSTGSF